MDMRCERRMRDMEMMEGDRVGGERKERKGNLVTGKGKVEGVG